MQKELHRNSRPRTFSRTSYPVALGTFTVDKSSQYIKVKIKEQVPFGSYNGFLALFKYYHRNIYMYVSTPITKKLVRSYLSRDVRKPDFCICENKDADQLRGNREADQRLYFRYTDSAIPQLSKSEILSL